MNDNKVNSNLDEQEVKEDKTRLLSKEEVAKMLDVPVELVGATVYNMNIARDNLVSSLVTEVSVGQMSKEEQDLIQLRRDNIEKFKKKHRNINAWLGLLTDYTKFLREEEPLFGSPTVVTELDFMDINNIRYFAGEQGLDVDAREFKPYAKILKELYAQFLLLSESIPSNLDIKELERLNDPKN